MSSMLSENVYRHDPNGKAVLGPIGSLVSGSLLTRFIQVRDYTNKIVGPLSDEDRSVQSMEDASPAKWHLAHTTWFFEAFVLVHYLPDYQVFDSQYTYLFNSYYEALGPRHPRPQRGLLSRPAATEIAAYRAYVDDHVVDLLCLARQPAIEALIELGLAHEQQHQELLLMDVLHLFSLSPLKPAYRGNWPSAVTGRQGRFKIHGGGLMEVGADGTGFAFDNEMPRHNVWLDRFEISDRMVRNREWLEFINDGGYDSASLWLSDGWSIAQSEGWQAPFYWRRDESGALCLEMTLGGMRALSLDAPVTHISYYEASAFATWAGARLPSESEWECAARAGLLEQIDDVAWQWTHSAYGPYPGFRASLDAEGEYNGKFMSGQMVLRGGAAITPPAHAHVSYRNFFRPEKRWMMSGLRLARDVKFGRFDDTKTDAFATDVIQGLSASPKALSPKYFYDQHGSALFEDICVTSEYYPTRSESGLLAKIGSEISEMMRDYSVLVEFGSGASAKTCTLLDAMPQIQTYIPIDISESALQQAARRLRNDYPTLQIVPLVGDFTDALMLPPATDGALRTGFFPGSTVGNFTHDEAVQFLHTVRQWLGKDARLIIGVDMIKDPKTLIAAYDDGEGVTAAFNKNVLERINRELGGDFRLDDFDHLAVWNDAKARMEMHLVSRIQQTVNIRGRSFRFETGERLHTESSHKFSIVTFTALVESAGWRVEKHWLSNAPEFAIFSLKSID